MPSGDADFFDEQPQELMFLGRVEVIDDATDSFGEVVRSPVDLVPAGEGGALLGEAGAFGLQLAVAGGDVGGASLQLGQLDQPGLVEVDQATFSASAASALRSSRASSAPSSSSSGMGVVTATACSPGEQ